MSGVLDSLWIDNRILTERRDDNGPCRRLPFDNEPSGSRQICINTPETMLVRDTLRRFQLITKTLKLCKINWRKGLCCL